MDIAEALRLAQKEAGWSLIRLAYESGVSENAARQWVLGKAIPAGDKLERLRAKMPALRRQLDAQFAPIRVDDPYLPKAA